MNKYWLKNYPAQLNDEINLDDDHSITVAFQQAVARYSDNIAYTCGINQLTFQQVEQLSRHFSAYLQTQLQIKKGDRVALMAPNGLTFVIAMWAVIRSGAVLVNVNPMYTARELGHQLNDSGAETLIIADSNLSVFQTIKTNTKVKQVIAFASDDDIFQQVTATNSKQEIINLSQALSLGAQLTFIDSVTGLDDLFLIQYTGGTTGLSKGAVLSQRNILANIAQFTAVFSERIEYGHEVVLTALPMYHIFAFTVNILCYFTFGAKNVLVANPRDLPQLVTIFNDNKPTMVTGVNTLFNGLLHTEGFSSVDFSALKTSIGGGAPVQKSVALKWFECTGATIYEGYGLSETSPILTLNTNNILAGISGIGIPVPATDISIRDENNIEVELGVSGELCAKGPQVMSGYWQNETATCETFTSDGFFKTGDIALLDESGYFHIVDRKKDMIIVSGFNVYPNEIENELSYLPAVIEAACVGVPDEKTGEAIHLYVVSSDKSLTVEAVRRHCQQSLTAYKVPKLISFVDELPKSTVGKLLRRELR